MTALNLKTLAAKSTSTLHLKDAAENLLFVDGTKKGEKLPVTVTVHGPGTREFQRAQAKINNALVQRMRAKGGKGNQSADESLQEKAEYLAAITVGFEHVTYEDKTGKELALAVYGDPSIGFIADQVNEHVKDWENFSQTSSTT